MSPHKQIENVYKDELDNDKVNLKERNEFVYQLVKFTKPQVILGWQISGKEGMLNATGRDRRGVVTEYIVKFLQRSGQWAHINNSHTGKEVCNVPFISLHCHNSNYYSTIMLVRRFMKSIKSSIILTQKWLNQTSKYYP